MMIIRIQRFFRVAQYRLFSAIRPTHDILIQYFHLVWRIFFSRPIAMCGAGGFIGVLLGMNSSMILGLILSSCISIVVLSLYRIGCLSGLESFCPLNTKSSILCKNDGSPMFYPRAGVIIVFIVLLFFSFIYISYDRYRADNFFRNECGDGVYDRVYSGYIVKSPYDYKDEKYRSYVLQNDEGVELSFYSSLEGLTFGDYVEITGRLMMHGGARNPGGFNYASYYASEGIYLKLITSDSKIHIDSERNRHPGWIRTIAEWFFDIRKDIINTWEMVVSEGDASVLGAMILGEKSALSEEIQNRFRASNLSHLVAVSGMHISCFLIPVTSCVKICGRRRFRQISTILVLMLFGFITDWTPSVSRAVIMTVYSILSSAMNRRTDPISGLFASSLILLYINPYVISNIGFQLSFGATFSIIQLGGRLGKKMSGFIPRIISQPVASMISAQIGMLPVMVGMASKQSPILMLTAIIGTMLSQWICILVIPLTFLFRIFLLVAPVHGWFSILFLPVRGLVFILDRTSRMGASDRFNAIRLQSLMLPLLVGICGAIIVPAMKKSTAKRTLAIITSAFLIIGLSFQVRSYLNRPIATVAFLDVGQGDSALIITDDMSVLIDGGEADRCDRVLIPVMDYYGIHRIDIAILSHLHSDHGGGLMELFRAGRINQIGVSFFGEGEDYGKLIDGYQTDGLFYTLKRGDCIPISENISLYVLYPEVSEYEGGNDDSLIILLKVCDFWILFMGDSGFITEESLMQDREIRSLLFEKIDIMKVGHHGSKYSSSESFLDAISPSFTVISVGQNNFYGHPTDEVITRLTEAEADIFRTDQNGAVIFKIYTDRISIRTMLNNGETT